MHSSPTLNSQAGDTASVHQGTDGQRDVVHLHKGTVSTVKRKEVLTSAMTRVNLEDTMLSDIGRTQEDKYYVAHLPDVPGGVRVLETGRRTVGARGWGWDGESLFHGGRVSVGEELDSGDGHMTM